jgi:hypothetical protein
VSVVFGCREVRLGFFYLFGDFFVELKNFGVFNGFEVEEISLCLFKFELVASLPNSQLIYFFRVILFELFFLFGQYCNLSFQLINQRQMFMHLLL